MKKYALTAEPRTIVGRKVKNLRQKKLLPANIFGKHFQSTAIELPIEQFEKVYKEAGKTGLNELHVGKDVRPTLIQNVQFHPLSHMILHADFYQVDLKEKVKARVPLTFIGNAPAVDQKLGVLLDLIDDVEVEALPTDLPEKIEVMMTELKAVGDTLKVSDLKLPQSVTVLTDSQTEIVKIGELVSKEAEALAQEEATKEAAQAVQAAEVSGETTVPQAAATPVESKQPESKAAK